MGPAAGWYMGEAGKARGCKRRAIPLHRFWISLPPPGWLDSLISLPRPATASRAWACGCWWMLVDLPRQCYECGMRDGAPLDL